MTYQTETKGTSLFNRHGNWKFVALSGERGGGVPMFLYPHRGEKGRRKEGEGKMRPQMWLRLLASPLSPPHLVALRVLA